MALRGPKSNAELTLVTMPARSDIEPPADLPEQAKGIFRELVKSCAVGHFRPADRHLLGTLATCIARLRHYDRHDDFKAWSECVKMQATLSTKLRLTPHSRLDARAGERSTRIPDGPAPWVIKDES